MSLTREETDKSNTIIKKNLFENIMFRLLFYQGEKLEFISVKITKYESKIFKI